MSDTSDSESEVGSDSAREIQSTSSLPLLQKSTSTVPHYQQSTISSRLSSITRFQQITLARLPRFNRLQGKVWPPPKPIPGTYRRPNRPSRAYFMNKYSSAKIALAKLKARPLPMLKYVRRCIPKARVQPIYMNKRRIVTHQEIQEGLQNGKVDEIVCLCSPALHPQPMLSIKYPKSSWVRVNSTVLVRDLNFDFEWNGETIRASKMPLVKDSELNMNAEAESLMSVPKTVTAVASEPALEQYYSDICTPEKFRPRTCFSAPNSIVGYESDDMESVGVGEALGLIAPPRITRGYIWTRSMTTSGSQESSGDADTQNGEGFTEEENDSPYEPEPPHEPPPSAKFYFKIVSPRCRPSESYDLCPAYLEDPMPERPVARGLHRNPPNSDVELTPDECDASGDSNSGSVSNESDREYELDDGNDADTEE